ncbi:hypothetical protein IPJ70_03685 [Candidatus Campbellbacteria bacterium]|nr:MAG: hypothetical protein IPJ70_03685 [Candidatus Campbellbacteria bacterium]
MFGNIFEKRSEGRLVPSRGSEDIATKTPGLDGVDRARGAVVGQVEGTNTPGLDTLDPSIESPVVALAESFGASVESGEAIIRRPISVAKVGPIGPHTPEEINKGKRLSGTVGNIAQPQESNNESPEEREERWRLGVIEAFKKLPFRPEEAVGGIELQEVVRKIQELGFATEKDARMSGFEEGMIRIIKDLVRQKKTG